MELPQPQILPDPEGQDPEEEEPKKKKDEKPSTESILKAVHNLFERHHGHILRQIPVDAEADIHMDDLATHYGFRADGDHLTMKGEDGSTHQLHVQQDGTWIHHHKHGSGVRKYRGKGRASLKAHLSQIL